MALFGKKEETVSNNIYQGKPYNKIVGIDVANSTIKAWTDNNESIEYRNTIKEINDSGLVFSFKTDYQMFLYNNRVYEVGDIEATGSGGRGRNRYNSQQFLIEAVIGITSILKTGQDHRLRVVTGVPSTLAKNKAVTDEVKANLLGKHTVKSVQWDKVEDVVFEIVDVIVVPQPLGTLYSFVYDDKSDSLNQEILAERALVLDVGWGTTDIATLESFRVRGTFGFDMGVSDFIALLQEEVNNKMPEMSIYSLNAHQLDVALLNSPNVKTPFGTFDLTAYAERYKSELAQKIYESVMSLGLEFNKFYHIVLTGGGCMLLEKELKKLFNDPRVILQDNAVMANVKGFYLLGKF
ncbi:MAG: ParM/StbA family protein [Christensenellaceae bacterium]|jgi:plasmid segregation protein ParM|nr:ParM/StbA family protein [Christensenellaceae bacterium]